MIGTPGIHGILGQVVAQVALIVDCEFEKKKNHDLIEADDEDAYGDDMISMNGYDDDDDSDEMLLL
eukprot:5480376-Karenia_brevis.AAC.1